MKTIFSKFVSVVLIAAIAVFSGCFSPGIAAANDSPVVISNVDRLHIDQPSIDVVRHDATILSNHESPGFRVVGVIVTSLIAAGLMLGLNTGYIPTPQDEAMRLEAAATTKTATFNGTGLLIGTGYAPGGIGTAMAAVVSVSVLDLTSGNETYTAVLQESADNATFTDAGPIISITATGNISIPGFISQPYARVKLTLGGTTPSITYEAWLNANLC